MNTCPNCREYQPKCICAQLDKFFKDNRELMDDLAKQEEEDKKRSRSCVICYTTPCRCKPVRSGLV